MTEQTNKTVLLVIVGPTGVGKSALAIRLSRELGVDVVSADSRQIYKEMTIGTGMVTEVERMGVRHYFIGEREVTDDYNAGQYARDCIALLEQLYHNRGDGRVFALLVGGSMMYIDAVCGGLDAIPEVSVEIKRQCEQWYHERGLKWLQDEVALHDVTYWKEVDRQNVARLLHCLEVIYMTGMPYSFFRHGGKRNDDAHPWEVVKIGLTRERTDLYQRIDARVDAMLKDGLVEETHRLYELYANGKDKPVPNSLHTVGYKELFAYFRGEYDLEEAVRLIKRNSRHYAKRQMTWWRKDKDIHWLDACKSYEENREVIVRLIDR